MGLTHFKCMYQETVEREKRALPIAIRLSTDAMQREMYHDPLNYWKGKTLVELMYIARRLVLLHNAFLAELRESIADGALHAHAVAVKPTCSGKCELVAVQLAPERVFGDDEEAVASGMELSFFLGIRLS